MKQEEIEYGNRLIVYYDPDCLGYTDGYTEAWDYDGIERWEIGVDNYCKMEDLQYRSSYDWLIPVIKKIVESTKFIEITECTEKEWFVTTKVARLLMVTDIEEAWLRVVNFLKWYNHGN